MADSFESIIVDAVSATRIVLAALANLAVVTLEQHARERRLADSRVDEQVFAS